MAQHTPLATRGPTNGSSHVHGVEHAELIEMFVHQIGQLEQHLLPIIWLERAPRAFKRTSCRCHGAVDILSLTLRYRRQCFPGRRVEAVKGLARGRLNPLTIDEHALELPIEKGRTRVFLRRCVGYHGRHMYLLGSATSEIGAERLSR